VSNFKGVDLHIINQQIYYERFTQHTFRNGCSLRLPLYTTCVYYACRTIFRIKIMEFKMKEATTKQEAIISLIDVQINKPELLPDNTALTIYGLDRLTFQTVRDLFVKVKTNYYNSQDNSKRF